MKELNKALNKAEDLQQVMKEHIQVAKETSRGIQEMKKSAQELQSSGKDTLLIYLRTIPLDEEYSMNVIGGKLKMDSDKVKRLLEMISQENPGALDLLYFSYMSKLLGKEPRVRKLKEI